MTRVNALYSPQKESLNHHQAEQALETSLCKDSRDIQFLNSNQHQAELALETTRCELD